MFCTNIPSLKVMLLPSMILFIQYTFAFCSFLLKVLFVTRLIWVCFSSKSQWLLKIRTVWEQTILQFDKIVCNGHPAPCFIILSRISLDFPLKRLTMSLLLNNISDFLLSHSAIILNNWIQEDILILNRNVKYCFLHSFSPVACTASPFNFLNCCNEGICEVNDVWMRAIKNKVNN